MTEDRTCGFCKRRLNNENDPLSRDCGGDCIHCMIREEADIDAFQTALNLCNQLIEDIRTRMRAIEDED